jgi:hypothetical protein
MFNWFKTILREVFRTRSASYALSPEVEEWVIDRVRGLMHDWELLAFLSTHFPSESRWALVHVHPESGPDDDKYLYLHWDANAREINWYDFEVGPFDRRTARHRELEAVLQDTGGITLHLPQSAGCDFERLNMLLMAMFLINVFHGRSDHPARTHVMQRHDLCDVKVCEEGARQVITYRTH